MSEQTPAIHRRRVGLAPTAPQVFEVLDCAKPMRPPARHSLAGIDEVVFVRAEERSEARDGRTLKVGIPDRTITATHARLRRQGEVWVIEDLGTRNGTFVDGVQRREWTLADRAVIELGQTNLIFRAAMRDDAPTTLDAPAPGLATILPPLAAELARVPAIARATVSVVIGGETGTGKEVIARAVHRLSQRRGPFVAVNCAAIVKTLIVSELCGYRRGAFAGATENRPGLVRAADGGTLFLDEIADLPLDAQAAVLRILAEQEVLAVGATEPVKVDVRVLCATHANLEERVNADEFRADLLGRLSGFTVKLPPLRWRREDLGLLIASFLRKYEAEKASLTCEAGRALLRYHWPMNIRELEKVIQSALVLAAGEPIDLEHLPASVREPATEHVHEEPMLRDLAAAEPAGPPRPLSPEDTRLRDELITLLKEHHGNVAAVARVMNKARMQIHRWVRRFDLRLSDFR